MASAAKSTPARTLGFAAASTIQINDWNCFKIARAAQISMDQLNASFLKRFAVQLASRAAEIVDANDLIGRVLIEKSMCKAAADKAADTRD
jgi:hypothetical protein